MSEKSMDRRQFLKFTSAGIVSSVVLNKWNPLFADVVSSGKSVSFLTKNLRQGFPTFCNLCPAQCGIIGFIDRKNWLAGIAGNPNHPNNRGKICARGIAGMNLVHDPERILYPQKRIGKRGSGKWKKISWEEAISEISQKIANANGKKIVFHTEERNFTGLTRRFILNLKNSEIIASPLFSDFNKAQAQLATWGETFEIPDVENSDYILLFGANPFESHPYFISLSERIVQARIHNGAKIITIDPRLSNTAGRSDQWLPVFPGTDAIVALAMAHVIMKKNLYNAAFINRWTNVSIAELKTHLEKYTPEKAAEISGIDKNVIEKIAVEFATKQAAVAISGSGITKQTGGIRNERSVMLLNALVGNIDRKGGYCLPKKFQAADFDAIQMEKLQTSAYYDAVENGREKIGVHFSILSNPAFETPESERITEILKNEQLVPFSVVADHVMSETAMLADIFLPVATHLESWNLSFAPSFTRKRQITLSQPVIEPRGESKPIWDIFLHLGKKLGGKVAEAVSFKDSEAYVRSQLRTIAGEKSEKLFKYLRKNGTFVNASDNANYESYKTSGFKTTGNKFKIKLNEIPEKQIMALPEFKYSKIKLRRDQLVLIPFTVNVMTPDLANAKWLAEISHESVALMNPKTARTLGLQDGEEFEISSSAGTIQIRLKVFQGIHPKAVAIRKGGGHRAFGRVALSEKFKSEDPDTNLIWWHKQGNGENPNKIVELKIDPDGKSTAFKDTIVEVKRI